MKNFSQGIVNFFKPLHLISGRMNHFLTLFSLFLSLSLSTEETFHLIFSGDEVINYTFRELEGLPKLVEELKWGNIVHLTNVDKEDFDLFLGLLSDNCDNCTAPAAEMLPSLLAIAIRTELGVQTNSKDGYSDYINKSSSAPTRSMANFFTNIIHCITATNTKYGNINIPSTLFYKTVMVNEVLKHHGCTFEEEEGYVIRRRREGEEEKNIPFILRDKERISAKEEDVEEIMQIINWITDDHRYSTKN